MRRGERIWLTATTFAKDQFVLILNPLNRGPNFSFDYPKLERRVESQLHISTPYENITTAEIAAAQKAARDEWDYLVEESGVRDWADHQPIC